MSIIDKYFIKKPSFRRLVTRLIFKNKDYTINIFDTPLYINSIKENGYYRASRLVAKSSLLRDEISILIALSNLIDSSTTFIDVGANVGLFCSTLSRFQALYPALKIYAFEANPDTFERLSNTIKQTQIKAYNYAVSDSDHELEFVQGAVSHVFAEKSHVNQYHFKNQKVIKVAAKRLDHFDIEGGEIVLKIDVEGHEYNVLQGAEQLFKQRRIKAVYIDGYDNKQILPFLKGYGFNFVDAHTLQEVKDDTFSLLALLDSNQRLV